MKFNLKEAAEDVDDHLHLSGVSGKLVVDRVVGALNKQASNLNSEIEEVDQEYREQREMTLIAWNNLHRVMHGEYHNFNDASELIDEFKKSHLREVDLYQKRKNLEQEAKNLETIELV